MTSQPQEKKVLEHILRINILRIDNTYKQHSLLFPPVFTKKPTLYRAVKDWIVWKRVKKIKKAKYMVNILLIHQQSIMNSDRRFWKDPCMPNMDKMSVYKTVMPPYCHIVEGYCDLYLNPFPHNDTFGHP